MCSSIFLVDEQRVRVIALALGELATNSLKYGTLGRGETVQSLRVVAVHCRPDNHQVRVRHQFGPDPAHDGHGERVERPAELPAALRRAAEAVRTGQQALVNVICAP